MQFKTIRTLTIFSVLSASALVVAAQTNDSNTSPSMPMQGQMMGSHSMGQGGANGMNGNMGMGPGAMQGNHPQNMPAHGMQGNGGPANMMNQNMADHQNMMQQMSQHQNMMQQPAK